MLYKSNLPLGQWFATTESIQGKFLRQLQRDNLRSDQFREMMELGIWLPKITSLKELPFNEIHKTPPLWEATPGKSQVLASFL